MNEILIKICDALFAEFGGHISEDPAEARQLIEKHVHLPEDDTGGWAPGSTAVIHAENIPLPGLYEIPNIEAWFRVSEALDGHYCEHINDAVVAIYPG